MIIVKSTTSGLYLTEHHYCDDDGHNFAIFAPSRSEAAKFRTTTEARRWLDDLEPVGSVTYHVVQR